jgi:DNA-binding GntR family transcriptional regulator
VPTRSTTSRRQSTLNDGSTDQRISKTRRADEVTDQLRHMILDGQLNAGDRLRQIELSEQLGVSRTPVREAFRVLEREGLIRVANGNQTIEVAHPSSTELIELYEVREMIDALAARKCATRGLGGASQRHLAKQLTLMGHASVPVDLFAYGKAHTEFHAHLVECSGNRRLESMLPLVRMTTMSAGLRFARQSVGNDLSLLDRALHDMVQEANEHHLQIIAAIEKGSPNAAEAAARRHIQRTIRGIERMQRLAQEDGA